MASEESCRDDPILCTNGCGFFASPTTKNLCSKCYRDYLIDEIRKKSTATMTASSSEANEDSLLQSQHQLDGKMVTDCSSNKDSKSDTKEGDTKEGARGNRCGHCNKRVRLMKGFECRCGNMYCVAHRHPEDHACTFDFKAAGKALLAKTNPPIMGSKLDRME